MTAPRDGKRRLWLLLLLVALLAGGAGWWWYQRPATPPMPAVDLEGVEPAVIEAVRLAQRGVEAEPRSAAAWGRLGRVLLAHSFHVPARECFANAELFDKKEPAYPYLQGICQLFSDTDDAERCFRRAQEQLDRTKSRDQVVRLRLVELLVAAGRLDEAETELALAERKADDKWQRQRSQFNRGLIASRRQQWQQAFDLLSPLAREPALRGLMAAHLARAAEMVGKGDLAAQLSSLTVGKDERWPWPDAYVDECAALHVGRRGLFQRLGEVEKHSNAGEALRELEGLARAGSGDPLVYFSLAGLYFRQGEHEKAERSLRQANGLAPGRARFHRLGSDISYSWGDKARQSGDAALARGRFASALESAKQALALSPKDPEGLLQRGRSEHALGRNKEALATLREAVTIRPESAHGHMMLGEVLADLGETGPALIHLERAVKLAAPGDAQPAEALKRFRQKGEK